MKTNIACIGTGSMGSAIMKALCLKLSTQDLQNIYVTSKNPEHAKAFAKEYKCNAASSNREAVKNAKYILIAVKPFAVEQVLKEISGAALKDAVVISMAAGVALQKLKAAAPDLRFARIMPNVPAQIGQGMTGLAFDQDINETEQAEIKEILSPSGCVEVIPESLMDCVTAVSGSSPAFVFMFIEALADAAVRCGMPRKQAYIYAAQTVKGSADLVLQTQKHPAALKDSVCSPSGTTIEGVAVLEKEGFRNSVISAVTAAYNKAAHK